MNVSVFSSLPALPRECALELARRGVPVFPCGKNKRPLCEHGFKAATTDPIAIANWWRRFPGALIGVPTGSPSGLMVHDFDSKAGDAEMMIAEIIAEFGPLRGPISATQNDGRHVWTKHHPSIRIGAGKIRPGYDFRGEGGYAIAPGSTGYRLIKDCDPEDPPAALIQALAAAPRLQPSLSLVPNTGGLTLNVPASVEDHIDRAGEVGSRHDSIVRLVWYMIKAGMSVDEVMAFGPMVATYTRWSPAETEKELHTAALGALKKLGLNEQAKTQAGPLQFFSLDQLESRDPPDWQIEGIMPEGALSVLFGDSATFKTFVALDFALCVAFGIPWQGRATKKGRVLYIMGEGQGGVANRVRAWRTLHELLDEKAEFHVLLQPVAFGDPKSVNELIVAIDAAKLEFDLVVVDTLARNFGPGDPDRTQDMTVFVAGLDRIRIKYNTGLLCIHHKGKDGSKGARNSSVLRAAADVEIEATREENSNRVLLKNTKQKEAEAFPLTSLGLDPVEFVDPRTGELCSTLVVVPNGGVVVKAKPVEAGGPLEKHILQVLAAGGTLTCSEVNQRVSGKRQNVHRALNALVGKGLVLKSVETPVVYWIAEQYEGDDDVVIIE